MKNKIFKRKKKTSLFFVIIKIEIPEAIYKFDLNI